MNKGAFWGSSVFYHSKGWRPHSFPFMGFARVFISRIRSHRHNTMVGFVIYTGLSLSPWCGIWLWKVIRREPGRNPLWESRTSDLLHWLRTALSYHKCLWQPWRDGLFVFLRGLFPLMTHKIYEVQNDTQFSKWTNTIVLVTNTLFRNRWDF